MARMDLIPVTPENVERFAAFRMEIASEELRSYYNTIDLPAALLRQGTEFFYEDRAGQITAAISLTRSPHRDRSIVVMISADTREKAPQDLTNIICKILSDEKGHTAEQDTIYKIFEDEEAPLIGKDLEAIGFERIVGNYRYVRAPGPPRPGEFPYAERARKRGYETLIVDDAYVAAHPDIFETLADLLNRAFLNWASVTKTTAEHIRSHYDKDANDILITKLGDEVASTMFCSFLGKEVLSPKYASLRKHWGSGASDLMSQHLAQYVADRWNVPIIGYADATNAASWKALERFGLTRDQEISYWGRRIPAGSTFQL
ncbi:hypothetical protein [Thalassospira alkalitolerans]|uniref:hypothetical protein n=1 Tax=Thalassospira alkalitolerans TaxID=1293890 RepID=UPI0030ECCAEB